MTVGWRSAGIGIVAVLVLLWLAAYVSQLDFRRQPWSERWHELGLIIGSEGRRDADWAMLWRWPATPSRFVWGIPGIALAWSLPLGLYRLVVGPDRATGALLVLGSAVLAAVCVKCLDAAIAYRLNLDEQPQ